MKVFIAGSVNKKINPKYLEGIAEIGNYLVKKKHSIICVGAPTGSIGEMYNTYIKKVLHFWKKKRGGYFRLKKKLKKHWKVTYNHSLESR